MRYACLVHFDPKALFDGSEASATVLRDGAAYLEELRASGALVSDAALQLPEETVTIQVREGKMSTKDGPFMETKEVLGGILVIEARDLSDAVRIAGGIPLARIGHVEVRPFVDFSKPRPKLT
ncbi:MAG: YciI family protein [Polyangiaceae bacterium]